MSVTNYSLEKAGYNHSKLKNVLYLISAEHVKDVHIDNGEAYIDDLSELPLRINGFNIQYTEETSLDERYKFEKRITLSMKGYVSHKVFGGRYYAIVEDNDGIYYMVNVDFPSRITHTFNLSQNTNQTDFTFHSLSNFPTIKLNADFQAESLSCLGYNVYGIDKLNLIDKNYAKLDESNKAVYLTDAWKNVEFIGNSCSFQEVYDGNNITDTISFNIPLNRKIGWSWNLLEFLDNLYSAMIIPKGGDNIYYSGFNFGLQPSYTISSASNNGESDTITVTLVEASNHGLTAAVDYRNEDYDTTTWRYVKNIGNIICYECVAYSRAMYLVQEEADAFGNPTGNYKVKDGYQSNYQMLNIVGTFDDVEQFDNIACGGDECLINTDIPSSIVFSSITCNDYTLSASCDWNISGVANYLTATPSSGNANQTYNIRICNTSAEISGQTSTFSIQSGNNIRIINVQLLKDSFINPVITSITCVSQDVEFSFNSNCPVTVTSIDSKLSYEISNSILKVTVPANLLTTSEKVWQIGVQDCNGYSTTLKIIQDKVYERWVNSGFYICVNGNSYKEEVRYTGETSNNINHITIETRAGDLIEENDSRCNNRMTKWEWDGNYYCVNGNKQKCIEQFETYDNGLTWKKTGLTQLGEIVERNSDWCNILPEYDWRLTEKWQCGDGTEYTFEYCDGRKFIMEEIPNSGGTNEYCITSIGGSDDIAYSVTNTCDWVTVTTGVTSFTVSIDENTDPTSDRECMIKFNQKLSGKQITLNVLQAAGSSECQRLLDNCCGSSQSSSHPDCDIQLGKEYGSEDDSVLDGATIRMTTTQLPDWLAVTNNGNYVTYSALTDNTSSESRYFTVEWEKVSGGTSAQCETASVIIKQLGGATPRPYRFYWSNGLTYLRAEVSSEAGVIDEGLISLFDGNVTSYTVDNECSWIGSYTADTDNFKIEYEENTGETSRSCTVYLYQDGTSAEMRLEINQAAAGASGETYIRWGDNLHPNVYSATTTWNGYVSLTPFYSLINGVETNAILSTDVNWIQTYNQLYYNYNEVKPNRNETIYLNPNTDTTSRTGLLTLTQKGGTDYIQVYITQGAYVADCTISTFTIPDNVCIGEPLNYSYTVADSRCDRTFYFNIFDASGNTFTSTSTPNNGTGTGTFDTTNMAVGTAQMSVVVTSSTISKEIQVNNCGSQFDLLGSTTMSTTWNGVISSIFFYSKVGNENVNAVMSSNVSWIKTEGSYYMNNNELRPNINNIVYLDRNSSENPRTGILTLTQKGTGRTIQITITQGAYEGNCKITSFNMTSGTICKGENINFDFTVADTYCEIPQTIEIYDANGSLHTTTVTPSNGSGNGSFSTSDFAIGLAEAFVAIDDYVTSFKVTIEDCESSSLFENLLTEFNKTLTANSISEISSGSTPNTYDYLKTIHDESVSMFNDDNSDLFKKSTYQEIYDYRNGVITNHDLGLSAMTSWLMAMQITEIIANSGATTNNQTKLFQTAYNIGGGKSAPVYGYSDIRSDVSVCRLAASALWAKNRAQYNFGQIDAMRTEMGTTVNNRSTTWKDFGFSTNGDSHICDNTLEVNVGYACALNDIFPAAAGPYATWYYFGCNPSNPTSADRQPDPQQPSGQFNNSTKNYMVDETIYDLVTNNYNLFNNNQYISRSVQAIVDDSLDTEDLFGNITYYKYNTNNPRYTFVAGSPSDYDGTFKGVFNQDVTNKDLSTLSSDNDAFGFFFHGVGSMTDNSKKTIGDKQYGRRRPSQGETDMSARCVCGGGYDTLCTDCSDTNCTKLNYLNDTSIERLIGTGTRRDESGNVYYVDMNGNATRDNGEPYYGETYVGTANECAKLNSTTYPSGHSSRVWGMALMLMEFIPSRWLEIYKAAYAFTVSRTIVRAHWNSDIIFGKLAATTFIPTVYSFNDSTDYNFRTLYNNAAENMNNGSQNMTCTFVIHNNTLNNITILNKLTIALDNDNHYGWDGCYNRYNLIDQSNQIIIAPTGDYSFVVEISDSSDWTTIRHFLDVDNCQTFKEAYPNNSNVFVYDENGNSETFIPSSISSSTALEDGELYHVYIN